MSANIYVIPFLNAQINLEFLVACQNSIATTKMVFLTHILIVKDFIQIEIPADILIALCLVNFIFCLFNNNLV